MEDLKKKNPDISTKEFLDTKTKYIDEEKLLFNNYNDAKKIFEEKIKDLNHKRDKRLSEEVLYTGSTWKRKEEEKIRDEIKKWGKQEEDKLTKTFKASRLKRKIPIIATGLALTGAGMYALGRKKNKKKQSK